MNLVVALIRQSREHIFQNFNSAKESNKKVNYKTKTLSTLMGGDTQVDTSQEKANLLNNLFVGCFNHL